MNKELREMLEKINSLKEKARQLITEDKIEEAKKIKDEIVKLQEKFDIAKELYEEEKAVIEDKDPVDEKKDDLVKEFINGLRNRFKNAMSEGTAADGGYTVPQDILTKVNELRTSKDALQNLITVEKVTAPTGSRVFKARAQQTGFAEVAENGSIPEKATPQFTQLSYSVKKYAGFLKVTNELLKDSDTAIRSVVEKWLGDESRVTRNQLILTELDKKAKTAIASVDDIKDILNVQLDPAFRYTSVIVTNQDGFNWLDKQKDSNGNYLLQPSVSSPTGKQLFGVDIVMVSNKDLPSDTTSGTKAPMIIGDLKEAIVMFEKEGIDIKASDVAGDAFTTDAILFRAIEREEVKTRDDEAFVYGQVTIA